MFLTFFYKYLNIISVFMAFILSSIFSINSYSAESYGKVYEKNGTPISGAMVSLFNKERNQKQTVFTDDKGRYAIKVPYSAVALKVRTPFYNDYDLEVKISNDGVEEIDVVLIDVKDEKEISDTLTASGHARSLEWENESTKTTFISQCNYCHQIGNTLTRRPRSKKDWVYTVRRMTGYGSFVPYEEAVEVVDALYHGFDGKNMPSIQSNNVHPDLADAKFEEWAVGTPLSFIHDADVASDGSIYGVDQSDDILFELNPKSGEVIEHRFPESDLPIGGIMAPFPIPIGIFTAKHGPHSLIEDHKGKLWITASLSGKIISFDIKTKKFEEYDVGNGAIYPHTLRLDKNGMIWFTVALTNQIGRLNPDTGEIKIVRTPSKNFSQALTYRLLPIAFSLMDTLGIEIKTDHGVSDKDESMPSPYTFISDRTVVDLIYGIDIDPNDGSVWYSKLFGDRIGRLNPDTLEIEEWETPHTGPRRMRFDSKGVLWIPSFDEGVLMKFDPREKTFRNFVMPKLSENEWEIPYALNVNKETDDVWITSNNSDRIFLFDQKIEEFKTYPSPTRVTFLRDLVFSKDGKVCSSHANLPAYATEWGIAAFICLDPKGGKKDRERIVNSLN